jgi:23S rRNA (uracil1939-C5)-methyltransferase
VVRRLGELGPRQVTVVACDPATLARDLAGLVAAGYSVERITMIDLFPQTYHMEAVVALKHN